jgi:GT2 family glycosyltransferase
MTALRTESTTRAETTAPPRGGRPVAMVLAELELSQPLSPLRPPAATAQPARLLVRLHGHPLGIMDLSLPESGLEPSALAAMVWARLSGPIISHLSSDGRADLVGIPPQGFGSTPAACSWRASLPAGAAPAAALIVNTCGGERLYRTLVAATAQDYPNFELVVVDNRPASPAVRNLLSERFAGQPGLRYVAEERPGLGRARNAGLHSTSADVVAFTDDDVLLDGSWLSWLVAGFGMADSVACVTGLILPLELETPAQLLFEEFVGWSKRLEPKVWDSDGNRFDHPLYPYTVGIFGSGASAAFRREVLLELGGFDNQLGIGTPACGGEDLDIYTRLVLNGHRLAYQPAAMLWHAHPRDMQRLERQTRLYGAGLGAMLTKHLVHSGRTRRELLRRLPAGLAYALGPRSPKNARKPQGYPRRLTLFELAGMAYGPIGYIRSRL